MPRKPLLKSDELPYHITARANNREWFTLPLATVWQIMIKELNEIQTKENIKIFAFVLMDNHYHLLLTTPKANIDKVMYWFGKNVTRKMQKATGRINKIFGGRYKGSLITNERHLRNVLKYMLLNPVRANLVTLAQEYIYSTLYFQNQKAKLPFDLHFSEEEQNFYGFLEWINQGHTSNESSLIKSSLKKTKFQYLRNKSSGKRFSI